MRESEVSIKVKDRFVELLSNVPSLEAIQPATQMPTAGAYPDLVFELPAGNRTSKIVVEVKSPGDPRLVRAAIQQLREYLRQIESAYGVVAAPYISNDTARLCKENGIGYIDLAGNCFLNFDQIYIERKNYPKPGVEKRQVRSIFAPKSSRILRVMFGNPRQSWQVQELAKEANVSIGLAFSVKERLLDLEYASEQNRGFLLSRPGELLDKWADSYSFRKNKIHNYFGFDSPREIEQKLAKYCQQRKILYALTLFSGAALVAPFARYTRGFAYAGREIQELAESLGLKEVSSGPNFSMLEPYDEGILYESRKIEGMYVVCDVQLYLDLVEFKGRGEESAKFLLEQRIKPQW